MAAARTEPRGDGLERAQIVERRDVGARHWLVFITGTGQFISIFPSDRSVTLTIMSKSASLDIRPLAATMGDPAGIGPEIVARMFLRRPAQRRWIAVGDPMVMGHALAALDPAARVRRVATPAEARFEDGVLNDVAPTRRGRGCLRHSARPLRPSDCASWLAAPDGREYAKVRMVLK
ncbi:hypothetical protein ACMAUO_09340 [Gluconacetobacter sp. Hr-1-5]|uniref:hypothetical protein n=1 Tax=Gluconacetobacter sp. Hr-1-5 TaxID=3395370 RepID=UPI003B5291C5